jgi:hypothetical protein
MKLPSIHHLWLSLKQVIVRFPLQVFTALFATGLCWYLAVAKIPDTTENTLTKLILVCNLLFTLLLAADLLAERKGWSPLKKWSGRIAALIVCTAIYFWVDPFHMRNDAFRLALFAFSFHLLVAFVPFMGHGNLNGFWQYNKTLFLRFITAVFYAAVLYAGLAIALVAVNELFNVIISNYAYVRLLAVVAIAFTTVFFLAGIPTNYAALDVEVDYPKGLKIFTQYVLIPLMTIYLAILLVYEVKIAISWELPKGMVSTLVLCYAVFGILSLLLIYPVREKDGNGWINIFSRFFYLTMIPLIILLLFAVFERISAYGITESRYLLIILTAWLTGITSYFLLSKKQNIKVIPVSLFILAILSIYGPQSAFSVSKASQTARFRKLLDKKTDRQQAELSNILKYLVEMHGLSSLQSFTKVDLKKVEDEIYAKAKVKGYRSRTKALDTAFAILKIKNTRNNWNNESFSFENENAGVVDVSGYNSLIDLDDYRNYTRVYDGKTFKVERTMVNLEGENAKIQKLTVTIAKNETVTFDIDSLVKAIIAQNDKLKFEKNNFDTYKVPASLMQLSKKSKDYSLTFVANGISGNYQGQQHFAYINFEGYLLIKK